MELMRMIVAAGLSFNKPELTCDNHSG